MNTITMEELLLYASEKGASDLHITVGVPPVLRIHGRLNYTNFAKILPFKSRELMQSIMSEQQIEQLEEFGEIDFSYAIKSVGRFRVNAFKQRGSVSGSIRLVDTIIPDSKKLGLHPSITKLYNKKRGLILVTGPTGSGKSTTLASIIGQINEELDRHVITLEDPIEYLHSHKTSIINQREMGLDSNNYANALRAALRQDPDVILVGEMRDLETISTAITAAETGHLVLSTLHTSGAVSTIERIIDVFPPHQQQQIRVQLAGVLEAVISQHLIPTVDGKGRVASFEVLLANNAIRNLIRDCKTHQIQSVIQTSKNIGMQTMDDSLTDLLFKGLISREDARYYSSDSVNFEKRTVR